MPGWLGNGDVWRRDPIKFLGKYGLLGGSSQLAYIIGMGKWLYNDNGDIMVI